MKKRVVLCVYHYFAHYRLPVLRELAKSQDFEFVFAAGDTTDVQIRLVPAELFAEHPGVGPRVYLLKNWWISGGPLLYQSGLLGLAKRVRPQAVIFLGSPYFLSTWIAAPLCRALGIKVLMWTHGAFREGSVKDKLRLLFFRMSDVLLLYGEHARRKLTRAGLSPNKMKVIYNSLDAERQLQLAKDASIDSPRIERGVNDRVINVLYCGRLTHQKRLEQLIEAGVILQKRDFQVNIVLIGDGEAMQELREQAMRCGGEEWVRFFGSCYDEAILAQHFLWAQVCVAPGEVGLTAMHSLAYGTPVVTHGDMDRQMPEAEAIVEGQTGALFDFGSVESLAEAIVRGSKLKAPGMPNTACMGVIDKVYNPRNQAVLIQGALNEVLAG